MKTLNAQHSVASHAPTHDGYKGTPTARRSCAHWRDVAVRLLERELRVDRVWRSTPRDEVNEARQVAVGVRADYDVNVALLEKRVLKALRHATEHADRGAQAFGRALRLDLLECRKSPPHSLLCTVPHGTGVHQNDISS